MSGCQEENSEYWCTHSSTSWHYQRIVPNPDIVTIPTSLYSETDFNPKDEKLKWVVDLYGVVDDVTPATRLTLSSTDALAFMTAYPTPKNRYILCRW